MLEHMLIETCEKYPFQYKERDKAGAYTLNVGENGVKIRALDPGYLFYSDVYAVPKEENLEDPEAFFVYVAQANYLGQGTGGNVLSVDESGKRFRLEKKVPYEIPFSHFLEVVEKFVNYLEYWRQKIKEFEEKSNGA